MTGRLGAYEMAILIFSLQVAAIFKAIAAIAAIAG